MAYNYNLNPETSILVGHLESVFRGGGNTNAYYNYEILSSSSTAARVQETVYIDYETHVITQTFVPGTDGNLGSWSPVLDQYSTLYDHGDYYYPKVIVQMFAENWFIPMRREPAPQSQCYWPHVLSALGEDIYAELLDIIVVEETSETTRKVKGVFREILGQRNTTITNGTKLGGNTWIVNIDTHPDFDDTVVEYDSSSLFKLQFSTLLTITPTLATANDENDIDVTIYNPNDSYFDSYIELVRADDRTPIITRQSLGGRFSTLNYTITWDDEARQRLYEYLDDSDFDDCYIQVGYCAAKGEPYTITSQKIQVRLIESVNGQTSKLAPAITCSVIDENSATVALTGSASRIVRYFSNARASMTAEGVKGAQVVSKAIVTSNATIYADSYLFTGITDENISFQATDTRGHTALVTDSNMVFLKYVRPTCNITYIGLPQPDDTCHINASGMYWENNFGRVDNELTFWYRYKSTSIPDYVEWAEVSNLVYEEADGSNYNAQFDVVLPNHVDSFTIQVAALDKLTSGISGERTVRAYPIFDWSENDFHFNIPVKIDGNLEVTGTITSNTPVAQQIEPADYIIEQGTRQTGSGNSLANWTFRKWNSGIYECWCRKHIQTAVNTTWGNLYVSGSLAHTNLIWPGAFIDIPVANITIAPNASGAFLIASGSTSLSATLTGGYEIARGSALASAGNFYINYYGIGRWK